MVFGWRAAKSGQRVAVEIQVVGRTTLGQGAVPHGKQATKDEVTSTRWSTE